jgi:hypothetical protein
MKIENIEQRLTREFKDRECFTREDLFEFYRSFEPDLKKGTFGWRIYDLKDKNIIRSIKRGVYVLSQKPVYQPEVSPELYSLAKGITEKFKGVKYCIWETEWLGEFLQHQASRRIILIEIEKDFVESLYYALKDSSRNELYLNPDNKIIEYYIAESNHPVVVKKLITRSPVAERSENMVKFYTPLLEKILVDLFAEEKLFYYLQGPELTHIYKNSLNSYTINFTKFFSYANRRGKEQEIKQFMENHLYNLTHDIIR